MTGFENKFLQEIRKFKELFFHALEKRKSFIILNGVNTLNRRLNLYLPETLI